MTAMAVISLIGTGLSALGQHQAGRAEQGAYEYNAQITERKTTQEEYNSRTRLRKLMASQRALYAKAGVDITSGSPLMVLADTAAEGEKEALSIRYGGQETAAQQRYYGKQAKKAGTMKATSTFLTGLGQAGTQYYYAKRK